MIAELSPARWSGDKSGTPTLSFRPEDCQRQAATEESGRESEARTTYGQTPRLHSVSLGVTESWSGLLNHGFCQSG